MGDSACWLHLVCPACGRVVDEWRDRPEVTCPHCRALDPPPDEGVTPHADRDRPPDEAQR